MASNNPPKAFISYSWGDAAHQRWVKAFAKRLRADGIDAILDKWHVHPGDRLPEFMERAVRENDFVLIICTPEYKAKSDNRKGGVGYEGNIITGELLNTGNERKFIPILRSGDEQSSIPTWLRGKDYVKVAGVRQWTSEYKRLLQCLLGHGPAAPPVGSSGASISRRASRVPKKNDDVVIRRSTQFDDLTNRVQAIFKPRMEAEQLKRTIVERASEVLLLFDPAFKDIAAALSQITNKHVVPEYSTNCLAGLKGPAGYVEPPLWSNCIGISDWTEGVHFFVGIEARLEKDYTFAIWTAYGLGGKDILYRSLWSENWSANIESQNMGGIVEAANQALISHLHPALNVACPRFMYHGQS